MNRTDIVRALTTAGFTCADHPQCGIKATSPLCLWDGTGVDVFVGRTVVGPGWFVCDGGQAHFMAVSTGMPLVECALLREGYRLNGHAPMGVGCLVGDLDAVISAAWDVVGYQISAHAYAAARRPDPSVG